MKHEYGSEEDGTLEQFKESQYVRVETKQRHTDAHASLCLASCACVSMSVSVSVYHRLLNVPTWYVYMRGLTKESSSFSCPPFYFDQRFLVFVNRVLAFFAAVLICNFFPQPKHRTPLYKYSFPSMSNVMSSWFQYEALKFVSFPTQVLAKACKVIPVMIMGKFVNGTVYPMVSQRVQV